MSHVASVQGVTVILPHVSTVSAIDQLGLLFVFSVSSGAYTSCFRFKTIEDARIARKEFVEALTEYWASR